MTAPQPRLLIVATEFPPGPGGIGTHAYQLARHCAAAGWDVTVLAPQQYVPTGEAESFALRQPFSVIRLTTHGDFARRTATRLITTRRVLRHLRPDVVVGSGNWAVWMTALADSPRRHRRARARVAIGHGMEFGRPTLWRRTFNHLGYTASDAVVCVSEYTRRRMLGAGIRPGRVEVIPNGGDATVFVPADDDRTGGDGCVLLSVGNISQRKGQDIVVESLPLLRDAGVPVRYVVVGLPTRAEELLSLADRLGVSDLVEIRGRLSEHDLVDAYRSCDIFCMTSREVSSGDFEGYGIAVIEAALCGKPSIVTGSSGLEEAVVAGETGIVIPPEDPRAFAEAVAALWRDEALRRRLGAAAQERARSTGRWLHRVRAYLDLFGELTGRAAGGP